jgi:DNA-binding Lrp family transcriptional regulator
MRAMKEGAPEPKRELKPEDYLRLTLEEYEALAPEELQKIAKHLNLSPEAFLALMKRGRTQGQVHAEQMEAKNRTRENFGETYAQVPPHMRYFIHELQVSPEKQAEADKLEQEAYAIFDNPAESHRAQKLFYQAQLIRTGAELAQLCMKETPHRALRDLYFQKQAEIAKTNIPQIVAAIEEASEWYRKKIDKLERDAKRWAGHSESDSYGSAEKFDTVIPLNKPKGGRPHRQNDELEGY